MAQRRGHLRVAPGLTRWVLPATIDRLEKEAGSYTCPRCGEGGDLRDGGDASLLLEVTAAGRRVLLAHAACMPSQVLLAPGAQETPDRRPGGVAGTRLLNLETGFLPADDLLPCLYLQTELAAPVTKLPRSAKGLDPLVVASMASGLHLLVHPGTEPPPVADWRVTVDESDTVRVWGPDSAPVALLSAPDPAWARMIRMRKRLVVLTGAGPGAFVDNPTSSRRVIDLTALETDGAAGHLAGGTVQLRTMAVAGR